VLFSKANLNFESAKERNSKETSTPSLLNLFVRFQALSYYKKNIHTSFYIAAATLHIILAITFLAQLNF
jgi:hypothetical protein